jgi:hypothetical protein
MALRPHYNIDHIQDDATPLIVHFQFNYADEFDINNYVLMTKGEYDNYLGECNNWCYCNKDNYAAIEISFGTNESLHLSNINAFKAYSFYVIDFNHLPILEQYFDIIANSNIYDDIVEQLNYFVNEDDFEEVSTDHNNGDEY